MTLARLIKELMKLGGDLSANRLRVVIDKRTFTHPLETDGCCMLDIESVSIEHYNRIDDDGCLSMRKDGSESMMYAVVLRGGTEVKP